MQITQEQAEKATRTLVTKFTGLELCPEIPFTEIELRHIDDLWQTVRDYCQQANAVPSK